MTNGVLTQEERAEMIKAMDAEDRAADAAAVAAAAQDGIVTEPEPEQEPEAKKLKKAAKSGEEVGDVPYAEHRHLVEQYKSLLGRVNSEGPRMAEEIRTSKTTIGAKDDEIKRLNEEIAREKKRPGAAPKPTGLGEDVDGAIDERIGSVRSIIAADVAEALRAHTGRIAALEQENASLREGIVGVSDKDYNRELERWASPDGRGIYEVNEDRKFLKWLDGKVPLTGKTRRDFLTENEDRNESAGVLEIFNAYAAEAGLKPKDEKPDTSQQRVAIKPGKGGVREVVGQADADEPTIDDLLEHNRRLANRYYDTHPEDLKAMKARIRLIKF